MAVPLVCRLFILCVVALRGGCCVIYFQMEAK